MKKDLFSYSVLLACIMTTIVDEKVKLSFLFEIGNIIALICVGTYFFIDFVTRIVQSKYSSIVVEVLSGIVLVFTSAFLAIFQAVQSADFVTIIKIMAITNGIFAFYLIVKHKEKTYSVRHFVISSLLIGVGVCF